MCCAWEEKDGARKKVMDYKVIEDLKEEERKELVVI